MHEATRPTMAVTSPRTGEVVAEVPVDGPAEVAAAVGRARDAQRAWGALPVADRAAHLKDVRRQFADAIDELAAVVAEETGKPRPDATIEVAAGPPMWSYVIANAAAALRPEPVPTRPFVLKRAWVERSPYGVVGVIGPWNYPVGIPMQVLPWVLACGNTVVFKPSELTPRTGLLVGEIVNRAGLALVEVVTGDGRTGEALVRGGIDKLEFTGSGATARRILAAAADSLTPTVMELGGKDAMVVCADADLDRAARTAVGGAFSNAGQTCMAVERAYVAEAVWEPFVARVLELTDSLRVGADDGSHVGPVTDARQIPVIEERLAEAVAGGARVLRGGRRGPQPAGSWFLPTVVVDVPAGSALATEETFGPVLALHRVAGPDGAFDAAAVDLVNDSPLGLSASVFTRDDARARRIAGRLETGGVVVNDAMVGAGVASVPFGGEKQSGFGRLQGRAGFDEFSRRRSVVTDRVAGAPGLAAAMFTGRRPSSAAVSRAIRLAWGTKGRGRRR